MDKKMRFLDETEILYKKKSEINTIKKEKF